MKTASFSAVQKYLSEVGRRGDAVYVTLTAFKNERMFQWCVTRRTDTRTGRPLDLKLEIAAFRKRNLLSSRTTVVVSKTTIERWLQLRAGRISPGAIGYRPEQNVP